MSNLESIVPPVELCKLIPAGEFEDTALVWDIHGKFDKWHVEKRVKRSVRFGDYGRMSPPHADISAPTLEEIINELPNEYRDGRLDIGTCYLEYITYDEFLVDDAYFCSEQDGFAAAALRLWFKVKGIEVEK